MKTPTQYGSENEESSFIRRIAAPDRANAKRRQKKRLAVVGATVGLIAASAVVGYAAMRQGGSGVSTVGTQQLGAKAKAVDGGYDDYDDYEEDVAPDDTVYPKFQEVDRSGDGVVDQGEFFVWLENRMRSDTAMVESADIPQDVKDAVLRKVESNFEGQSSCAERAFNRMGKYNQLVTDGNFETLVYAVEEFCPTERIKITPDMLNKYVEVLAENPNALDPVESDDEDLSEQVDLSLTEENEVEQEVVEALEEVEDQNGGEALSIVQQVKIEEEVREEYVEEKVEEESLTETEKKEVQEEVKEAVEEAEDRNGDKSLTDAQEEKIEDDVREEYIEQKEEEEQTETETDTEPLTYTEEKEVAEEVKEAIEQAENRNGDKSLVDAQKEKIEEDVREEYIEEKKEEEQISTLTYTEELVAEEEVVRAIEVAEVENGDESLTPCDVEKIEDRVHEEVFEMKEEDNLDRMVEKEVQEEVEKAIEKTEDSNGGEDLSVLEEKKIEEQIREEVKTVIDEVEKAIEKVEEQSGGEPLTSSQEEKVEDQVRLEVLENAEDRDGGKPVSRTEEDLIEQQIRLAIEMEQLRKQLETESLENGSHSPDETLTNSDQTEIKEEVEKTIEKAEDLNGGETLSPVEEKKIEVEVLKEIVEEKKEDENLDRNEEEQIEDEIEKAIEQSKDLNGGETLSPVEENKIEVDILNEHIDEKKEEENLSSDEKKEVQEEVDDAIKEAEEDNGSETLSPVEEKKIEVDVVDNYIDDKKQDETVLNVVDIQNIIDDLGGFDEDKPSGDGDKSYMTKEEFRQQLLDHFAEENKYLDDVIAKANAEYEARTAQMKSLDDCIERAANKFGWYGVYEEAPHFENAVDWVANICKKGLE